MADAPNILAQGTVDTTDETVYTVPASTSAIVTVIVANTTGSDVTGVIVYANGVAATNALIPPIDLASHEMLKFGPVALGTGDTIGIGCSTGDDVATYTVEGIEFS